MRDLSLWNCIRLIVMFFRVGGYLLCHPKTVSKLLKWLPQYVQDGGNFADNDYYEWSMGQLFWHRFKHLKFKMVLTVRKKFKFPLPPNFAEVLREKLNKFAKNCSSMHPEIATMLDPVVYLRKEFLDFLRDPSMPKFFAGQVTITQNGNDLAVEINGPGYQVSWLEETLLHLISTTYYEMTGQKPHNLEWMLKAQDKMVAFKKMGAPVSEFGTRRRFNFWTQLWVNLVALATGAVQTPKSKGGLVGTSNVFIAYLLDIPFMGTMAHKAFMALGAAYGQQHTNPLLMKAWTHEFGNMLGYFLMDTQNTEKFLEELTLDVALGFTGPRQDSGDPKRIARLVVAAYKRLGLSAKWIASKTIIFSDNLNVEKVEDLIAYCRELGIGCAFGVGTFLSNDIPGIEPTSNVIKLYSVSLLQADGTDVPDGREAFAVKISDDETGVKHMGDPDTVQEVLAYLRDGTPIHSKPLIDEWPAYLTESAA